MHNEIIRETNDFFNKSGIKGDYIKFTVLTILAGIGVIIVLSVFQTIPFLGDIIFYLGAYVINSCIGVFRDVSTYKAFSEGKAPELVESFEKEIKDGQGNIERWIMISLSVMVILLIINYMLVMLDKIIGNNLISIIISSVIYIYFAASFNYLNFFLADSRFDSYGPIQLIIKCHESMKGHIKFYIIENIRRATPVLVAIGIVVVVLVIAIYIESVALIILGTISIFAVAIFTIIYNLFFIIPYIKILSFKLYNSNLIDEF